MAQGYKFRSQMSAIVPKSGTTVRCTQGERSHGTLLRVHGPHEKTRCTLATKGAQQSTMLVTNFVK
jgi:hypothetical protein